MNYTIRSVLFIDLHSLPENIQTQVLKQANGNRDSFEEQKSNNNFKGSFKEFIEKYNLLLDKHLIDNNVPLDNVTDIIIESY